MVANYLDFEAPLAVLQSQIDALRNNSSLKASSIVKQLDKLEQEAFKELEKIYKNLTPWQKVQVARHTDRPRSLQFVENIFTDIIWLSGDRVFGEDAAMPTCLARLNGQPVVVISQERGKDTQTRIKHNFGMAKPEGYRKAQRLMKLADRFQLPIITFIDTPGAYPGVQAEERGQAEAIAKTMEVSCEVAVPMIAVVIGEGGSGGAIAIGLANRVYMLEHAVYSVISPEGCASILWRTADAAETAANALKITAQDLIKLKIIDAIISEPIGGAHRDPEVVYNNTRDMLTRALDEFKTMPPDQILQNRLSKFAQMAG